VINLILFVPFHVMHAGVTEGLIAAQCRSI
jgi:hypothetical protein